MCVSRMNCVCWANLFCAVQELFQRHYGEKSCILPPLFGRELKTKLPELRCAGNLLDEGVRDQDWNHKLIHKEHADNK